MDLHEFELRYRAYKGLKYKFSLDRDEDTIVSLSKISRKGVPDKKIQELTPEELQQITLETYTTFKKKFVKDIEKELPTDTVEDKGGFKGEVPGINLKEYIERLEYELKVIKEMGFNSYFLIVADFIRWAKKNTIVVGPGRGSGAGSLLAWLMRITDVDPLPFGLLFERFLNPARVSMPDFDIDFEDELREKVIDYVTEKYGKDKVCAIGTYMTMATKAAFKDAARAIGIPFDKSNQVSNLMPDGVSIEEAINTKDGNEELKNIYDTDPKVQKAAKFGGKLEGNLRQLGVHACGIIISPENITNYTTIQHIKDNKELGIVSQYDGPTLETIGLLKMDFLGLRNLSVIKNCINIVTRRYERENREIPEIFKGFQKDTSFLPTLEDSETFEKVFQAGNTTGIFQFESEGMRRFLVQLKANSINDLVAMNALYRPGPMEFIPSYIDRKHGKEKVTYMQGALRKILFDKYGENAVHEEETKLIEDLDPIMNVTYGIAVYQEQLMFLVQSMAGFSLAEADLLRRGIGKKKIEVIEQLKKEFIKRGEEHRDYKPETAKFIYEKMIEPAASYSFNKSHSVCYSLIAYQTGYLKAHYPIEFYAALIRSVEEDTDEMSNYIYEAQLQGIYVLPPDVNQSFNHVAAINNQIRLGFVGIKGIGREIGESLQEERKKNGIYENLEDFMKRNATSMNKKSLESLGKAGALDQFVDRKTLLNNMAQVLDRCKGSQTMDMGLFGAEDMNTQITFTQKFETNTMEKLMMEYDTLKSFVSSHPFDGLYRYLKRFSFISQFKNVENAGVFIIVGYIKSIQRARKKGVFVLVEDISGQTEFFLRDMLDLKKFDIVIIHGYKGRNASIDKIIKTSRSRLIKKAGGKFDPAMTATKVKEMRAGENLKRLYDTPVKLENPEKTTGTPPTTKQNERKINTAETSKQTEKEVVVVKKEEKKPDNQFTLPDNISKIHKITKIIAEYAGEEEISIGKKTYTLNKEGVKKMKALLG